MAVVNGRHVLGVLLLFGMAIVTFFTVSPRAAPHRALLQLAVGVDRGVHPIFSGGEGDTFLGLNPIDDLKKWMANADIELHSSTGVSSAFAKIHKRLLLFCYDVLPESVTSQYSAEMAALGINWTTERLLTDTEKAIKNALSSADGTDALKPFDKDSYNYFGFLPHDHGRVIAGKTANTWESPCWKQVSAETTKTSDGWELSIKVSGHKKIICADYYMFATASSIQVGFFPTPIPGTKKYKFSSAKLSQSEVWDVDMLGIRAFRFRDGPMNLVRDLFETALLFTGEILKSPPAFALQHNVDFLQRYMGITMKDRLDEGGVLLNETEIGSGDFFGIIRLDGLDPMIAWGMGSHTGHTAVAMWEDGHLYVTESTAKGTYWPTNGIQRTPYRQWITQARAAGFSVVHAPLASKYRKIFDAKGANAFFHSQEGLDYGYGTLLVGWVDSPESNYPCLPPYDAAENDKYCLTWPLVEVLFPILGKALPVANKIYLEAWNQHVTGSAFSGLQPTEIYRAAARKNIAQEDIFRVVEKDGTQYSQVYNNGTETKGIAMVCDVFVCFMWKAAGLFKDIDNDFNCVEQTNSDMYDLTILAAPEERPKQCVAADPDNKLCQIMGKYSLELPAVGTVKPYKHMQESCPSSPPDYKRSTTC